MRQYRRFSPLLAAISVLVIACGGLVLARDLAAHTCSTSTGCTLCCEEHEGTWHTCIYACGGATCAEAEEACSGIG